MRTSYYTRLHDKCGCAIRNLCELADRVAPGNRRKGYDQADRVRRECGESIRWGKNIQADAWVDSRVWDGGGQTWGGDRKWVYVIPRRNRGTKGTHAVWETRQFVRRQANQAKWTTGVDETRLGPSSKRGLACLQNRGGISYEYGDHEKENAASEYRISNRPRAGVRQACKVIVWAEDRSYLSLQSKKRDWTVVPKIRPYLIKCEIGAVYNRLAKPKHLRKSSLRSEDTSYVWIALRHVVAGRGICEKMTSRRRWRRVPDG